MLYDDESIVGAGWIEYPFGSRFAEIHGGSVLPGYRGKRIYSRLFEERAEDALRNGVPFVAVDAAPMSRPILKLKGFVELSRTYPLTKRVAVEDDESRGPQR